MKRFAISTVLGVVLTLVAWSNTAAESPKYQLKYALRFLPSEGLAAIEITTRPETGRLIALDFDMPADTYNAVSGDGSVERQGSRVLWTPPRTGGSFRYRVVVDHRRSNGAYDSRMTADWAISRGDRLFPAAKVRATKGSGSAAKLSVELPPGWDDVETPFSKIAGGDFAVTNAERKFDRPVGWLAVGNLSSTRETIAGARVTVTVPRGERAEHVPTMAVLRQALPEMLKAFGKLPEKILIVRSGDPMWRGGLSAPGSLWLHTDRPLLSANGTSPLLHELTHVLTDIHGGPDDDWIGEGTAEFYSLEIGRRSGLISEDRFLKSIRHAARSGEKTKSLRGAESTADRTRKAVALFAVLDKELHENGSSGIDALTRLLMRRETVTLSELKADAGKIEGHPSLALANIR